MHGVLPDQNRGVFFQIRRAPFILLDRPCVLKRRREEMIDLFCTASGQIHDQIKDLFFFTEFRPVILGKIE